MSLEDEFFPPACSNCDDWWGPPTEAEDWDRTFARTMNQSLLGGPVTVFFEDGPKGQYVYRRGASSNPDWFQEFDGDRKKLRQALDRAEKGLPLNMRRKEDRWLAEATKRARRDGWCATYHGKSSPLCVDPDVPLKQAHVPTPRRRVYLVLPEQQVRRLRARASSLHETPNRYLNEMLANDLSPTGDSEVPF